MFLNGLHHPATARIRLSYLLIALLGCMFFYLLTVASRLQVEYFDAYENLINARAIAQLNGERYAFKRPPITPLLLSPAFVLESLWGPESYGFVASHMLAVCITAGLLFIFYRFLRMHLSFSSAVLGTALLASNRLVIHFSPFAMHDITSAAFTTAAFYAYARVSEGKRALSHYLVASVVIGLAMLSRFNLIPLFFVVIGFHEIVSGNFRPVFQNGRLHFHAPGIVKKILAYGLLPLSVFFLLPAALLTAIGISPLLQAPVVFLRELLHLAALLRAQSTVSPLNNFTALTAAFTGPVILCAVLGIFESLRRKTPGRLIHYLWFFVFFITQTFLINHKEPRYLLPLFPPICYFAVIGIESVAAWFKRAEGKVPRLRGLRILIFLALFFFPAQNAARELLKFRDPFYYDAFGRDLSVLAVAEANRYGENRLYWVGPYFETRPKVSFLDSRNSGYNFDLYTHVLYFYTGRRPLALVTLSFDEKTKLAQDTPAAIFPIDGEKHLYRVEPPLGEVLQDRDILLVNTRAAENTGGKGPMVIQRLHMIPLTEIDSQEEWPVYIFPNNPRLGRFEARHTPEGLLVTGEGLAEPYYEIYIRLPGTVHPVYLTRSRTEDGRFAATVPDFPPFIPLNRLSALYYKTLHVLHGPDAAKE